MLWVAGRGSGLVPIGAVCHIAKPRVNAMALAMPADLALTVNGEPRRAPLGSSIADLVALIGLNPAKVAVERNGEIARRGTHGDVTLADGDILEIVHFVGGG